MKINFFLCVVVVMIFITGCGKNSPTPTNYVNDEVVVVYTPTPMPIKITGDFANKAMVVSQKVPINATSSQKDEVKYTSSNEDIAIVDNTGLITAVGEGSCIITINDEININVDVTDTQRKSINEEFYYEKISPPLWERIYGLSYPTWGDYDKENLRIIKLLHYDFNNNVKTGEIICNKDVAQDVLDVFYELYEKKYPLESVRLIDDFSADDQLSMEANNTSCFNYRLIAGSEKLSNHSYGRAIDINPLYNPHVKKNSISPKSAVEYADRTKDFAGKINKDDLCYKLFTQKGWKWAGDWEGNADYQHFEKK